MINITLDTSCFDKASLDLLEMLNRLQQAGIIKLWRDGFADIEKEQWASNELFQIKLLMGRISDIKSTAFAIPREISENETEISLFMERERGYSLKNLHDTQCKVEKILYPEGFHGSVVNKYIDCKTLARHIVNKWQIFVTKDKGFIKAGKKEKLEREFPGLKIRFLGDELIKELSH